MNALRTSTPKQRHFSGDGGFETGAPAAPSAASDAASRSIWSARFVRILIAQTIFGLGWSLYLLTPKYFALELGADAPTLGHLSAMGGLFSVAIIPLLARGIDRLGGAAFFASGCVLLLIAGGGFMLVHQLGPALYVLNGLIGASCVVAFNAGATLATDQVPASRMGQAIGVFGASNMIMNGISTLLGEKIAAAAGWNHVFALSMLAAGVALALGASSRQSPRPTTPAPPALESAGTQRSPWPLLAITALLGSAFSAMFVFSQPYALARGAHEVSHFFIGFTAIAVITRAFLGHLGDRLGHMRVSVGACALYALAAVSMTELNPHWLLAHGALLGLAHGVLYPTLNAVLIERVGLGQRGRAMTLYTGAFNVGTSTSAFGWGLLAQVSGYRAVYLGATALCLLATAALLRSARNSA